MSDHAEVFDVAVIGAGPVGLALAGDLAEAGLAVIVIEKLSAPMSESRASTLHARSMVDLADRGVLDLLGTVPHAGWGHFGGIGLTLAEHERIQPYSGQWKCRQVDLEAALGRRARASGASVVRGREVTGLRATGDHVEVMVQTGDRRETRAARYVVGCDGEDSTVARVAGFGFGGTEATTRILRADVAGIDIPQRRFQRLPAGFATSARWPDGSTRVMVNVRGAPPGVGPASFAEVARAWRTVTGESIDHGQPLWCNAFGDQSRHAMAYRRGRVIVAGDAAHRQMPIGGLAVNMGLRDAFELSGRLAACVRADDVTELDDYQARRHREVEDTLAVIHAQSVLLLGGPEVDSVRSVLTGLTGVPGVQRHLAGLVGVLACGQPGRATR